MKIDYSSVAIPDRAAIRTAAQNLKEFASNAARLRVFTLIDIENPVLMVDDADLPIASNVFGWSTRIERRWRSPRFALASPMRSLCRMENRAFWVSARGVAGITNNPNIAAIDFSDLEKRWLTKAAIVVPVYLPFSQIAMANFTCDRNIRDDLSREFAEFGHELQQLSTIFLSDYYNLRHRPRSPAPNMQLTVRERECLLWISRGKTDEETAIILSCRRPTVRFHLHNASVKLGVTNRAHAIRLAVQLGYLPGA